MKIFQNLYSLILGIVIGLLTSFAAITLGFLALVAVVYTDRDKEKKKPYKFAKTKIPEPVIPTDEEAKEASSTDDIAFERMFRAKQEEIGQLVNNISEHLTQKGFITTAEVYNKIGRNTSFADYNRGWTNKELNVSTIEMIDPSAGYVTLVLPEAVPDIRKHFTNQHGDKKN